MRFHVRIELVEHRPDARRAHQVTLEARRRGAIIRPPLRSRSLIAVAVDLPARVDALGGDRGACIAAATEWWRCQQRPRRRSPGPRRNHPRPRGV